MDFDTLATLTPVNGSAAAVTSQSANMETDLFLSRAEIVEQLDKMCKKHRRIKLALKITNKRQHKNLMYRYSKRNHSARGHWAPRLVDAYVAIGQQIQRFSQRLAQLNLEKKNGGEATQND